MNIESLELSNYRNYKNLYMDYSPKTNLLFGNNAQGKTNILEAIYMCAAGRSHRGSKDKEEIKFGEDEAHIKININKNNINYRIDIHLKKNRPKGIAINGIPIKKTSELLGIFNVVFFSPEDLSIIKNGPSERRRFLDMELCQLNSLYVHSLICYNKILIQRNKLLKEFNFIKESKETLDILDIQLIKYGKEIIRYREVFIDELKNIIKKISKDISGEYININYEKNIEIDKYEEKLKNKRNEELKLKMTLIGPHRDDISFCIDGVDIRRFGSQGQQRTAALSLKLSEIELVKEKVKDTPVLLLDDVLSELDKKRQSKLLEYIGDIQTVITCTGLEDFINSNLDIDKIYNVDNAILKEVQKI